MKMHLTTKDKFDTTVEVRQEVTAIYVDALGNVSWKSSAFSNWDAMNPSQKLFGLELWETADAPAETVQLV